MSNKLNLSINLILVSIVLTTVINGSVFWLKRVGWLESQQLSEIQQQRFDLRLRFKQSKKQTINPEAQEQIFTDLRNNKYELKQFLYEIPSHLYWAKALKYLVISGLLLLCLYTYVAEFRNSQKTSLLLKFLCLSILISIIFNLSQNSWQVNLSGIYSIAFIGIALTGYKLASKENMELFAKLLISTFLILLIMALLELQQGVQLFQNRSVFGKRVVGFMNQPNSLGIYVVCICSFFLAFYTDLRQVSKQWLLLFFIALTAVLVFLSGSNTALIAWAIILIFYLATKFNLPLHLKLVLPAIAIALTSLLSAKLIGRFNWDSIAGRMDKYLQYFSNELSIIDLLFGHGPGSASNLLIQISSKFPLSTSQSFDFIITDSTPLSMIIQTGLIGCILFYTLILLAAIKDSNYRLFYFVIIVCSLSINITELFPVNLILGLALASSLSKSHNLARASR